MHGTILAPMSLGEPVMMRYCIPRALLPAVAVAALMLVCSVCLADVVVFSESFDDGDWTANPVWETAPADPSVSISGERSLSPPYSLKIAAANNMGAIRTASGLASADKPFTCTFSLYVQSLPEEAIPWCLQRSTNSIIALIFLLPNGKVELANTNPSGGWLKSDVPYALSYGQWHSFKITYDGTTENLYIDGHEQPDASITQTYIAAPTKLCIGNFSLPHTGTVYIDDVVITAAPPPPPGRVYVQFCSDTSTGGIGTSNHYNNFPADDFSYTSPTGQAAQVFAESYRDAHRDSLGNPIKLTWYMNCGSVYAGGVSTGPLLPFELMMDYHGADVARCGDEMAYHYHTWVWDGVDWVQAAEFTECLPDFEATVAHLVLDQGFYPASFRSGWNWMSNYWEDYLDDWIIYRFEGSSSAGWVPYHPSPTDWRSPGSQRGWEAYYGYTPTLSQSTVNAAFANAFTGTDQIMTYYSHLKETDFAEKIAAAHALFAAAHATYPTVEFEYLTGRESMLKWRKGADTTSPIITVSTSDSGGARTAVISTDEDIYQPQPFIAIEKTDGTYSRIDAAPAGTNRWTVSYGLSDTAGIAAAVTDWFGNATVKDLPVPLVIVDLVTSVTSTSAEITWQTSLPADTRLDWRIMPSGSVTNVRDSALVKSHRVSLTSLQPSQVYRIDVAAENGSAERAEQSGVFILTKPMDPIVIDNSDPGFGVVGTWSTGSSAAGRYGADYRFVSTSPTGTNTADWTWHAPSAALYAVSLWWSQGGNRSTEANYSVITGGVEYPLTVNQQADGGTWNLHGIYDLAAGQAVTVRLSNIAPSGYVVIADAVEFRLAYTPLASISLARFVTDGTAIALPSAVVTAVFDGEFYVEEGKGIAGIKVMGTGVTEGSTVQVSGTLSTVNGERAITNPTVH